jgi:hypothetical protein
MRRRKFFMLVGVALLAPLALGACREDEQGRVLRYKKGIYLGKPDSKLSDEQERLLRERAQYQGSSVAFAPGGGGERANVRPPGPSTPETEALKERVKKGAH